MSEPIRSNTIENKKSFLGGQAKITNIGAISDTMISNHLEEILFGCAVCANSHVVN